MGRELIAALPIAGYWLDRRRRHKNKPEEVFNPKNFSDNPLVVGRSNSGDTRGSAPLFSESRSTKEKKARPVVHRFGLRKKGISRGWKRKARTTSSTISILPTQ